MSTKTFIILVIISLMLGVVICMWVGYDSKHKYQINYQHGKYGWTDYTDSIIHGPDQSITYVDEKGNEVTRYGTYSISKNKNYKAAE